MVDDDDSAHGISTALTRPQSMGSLEMLHVDPELHKEYIAEAILLRDNDRTPVQADYDDEIIMERVALRQRVPTLHRERAKSF